MAISDPLRAGAERSPAHEIWAAVLVMMVVATSPRVLATFYGVLSAATVGWYLTRRRADLRWDGVPTVAVASLVFAGFALASIVWSGDRGATLGKSTYLALIVVGSLGLVRACAALHPSSGRRLVTAAVAGLLAAFVFAAFESATSQLGTRIAYTWFPALYAKVKVHVTVVDGLVVAVSETNINRRVGLMTLMVWPTALLMLKCLPKAWCRPALAGLALLAGIMIAASGHQSSQLAAAAGLGVFVLAVVSARAARFAVGAAWIAAILLIVPAALLMLNGKLYEVKWLPHSARDRVAIWGHTASEVAKAPLLGIGADATRKLFEARADEADKKVSEFHLVTSRHAHNGYLQIWYELGLVGAILFMIAGLAALSAIALAPVAAQPAALAHFATFAAIISTSYGIWQMWFLAAIAASWVAMAVACVTQPDRSEAASTA